MSVSESSADFERRQFRPDGSDRPAALRTRRKDQEEPERIRLFGYSAGWTGWQSPHPGGDQAAEHVSDPQLYRHRRSHAPEFDVSPDPRTGEMDVGPTATLKINVTDSPPDQRLPTIYHEGYYYSVNDTVWDRTAFLLLSVLFQTTIGKVENVGIPITISK